MGDKILGDKVKKKHYEKVIAWGIALILLAIISPFITPKLVTVLNDFLDFEVLNEYGGWIGGTISPLLSLASFLLLYAAIIMQKEELSLQRSELELQRSELSLTRLEFKQQNDTMTRQRFDDTFFNMIALHNDIVRDIFIVTPLGKSNGRRALHVIYESLKENCDKTVIEQGKNAVVSKYEIVFTTYQSEIGHYFRNLYRIVKYIHEANLDDNEKFIYIGVIKAQLSSNELALILYNCLSKYGREKFMPLVIKYRLLENVDPDLLIDKMHFEYLKG